MAKIDFYNKFFDFDSIDKIHRAFSDFLLLTNRAYNFFVDWEKIKKNLEKYKIEIGVLSSLVNSKNFESDLRNILTEYPKTRAILPILIAMREIKFDILDDIETSKIVTLDFSTKETSENYIDTLIRFAKKSGIEELFKMIRVLNDYVLGVEVGLDTNARKNRSGKFMENIIKPILLEISKNKKEIELLPKVKFKKLAEKYKVKIPRGLQNRTSDFTIRKKDKLISIEVNFYSGQGSKPQEIVDAYINRQRELRKAGWQFIWITDGNGWLKGVNQIKKAISEMDFVLNIHFAKKGFLKYIFENL